MNFAFFKYLIKFLPYFFAGYYGVHDPITIKRSRYDPEIREPILMAAESIGYKIVDPNEWRQTGEKLLYVHNDELS